MIQKVAIVLLLILILLPSSYAMDRETMRITMEEVMVSMPEGSIEAVPADTKTFSLPGEILPTAVENALDYLNFLRGIAGLGPVITEPLYTLRAQYAACLLAANDEISHAPVRPEGMRDEIYDTACAGAAGSDLARLNWVDPKNLVEALSYFVREDGENNTSLPHRRWLLDPGMRSTGFGLAVSETGSAYIAMYAVDGAGRETGQGDIFWPSEGDFPCELMRGGSPWSVIFTADDIDVENSTPEVTLTETVSGEVFELFSGSRDGNAYIDAEPYGPGPCLIFGPSFTGRRTSSYEQNQIWHVEVSGLRTKDGSTRDLEYETRMISLTPVYPVNIEVEPVKAELRQGEVLPVSANVIPAYADDLSVQWLSEDPSVAAVDADGMVTATGSGSCRIVALDSNGDKDFCFVTVK